MDRAYETPRLVLFNGFVQSACGTAQSAVGPFYCPLDSKVYIDLSFLEDMDRKLESPGDFAQAYVIAHEVGHHIQNLLGIAEKVTRERMQARRRRAISSRSAWNYRPTASPEFGRALRTRPPAFSKAVTSRKA